MGETSPQTMVLDGMIPFEIDMSAWPAPDGILKRCKYGVTCDLLGHDPSHCIKFSHPCWVNHAGGGDSKHPPGTKIPIKSDSECTCDWQRDPKHTCYLTHPVKQLGLADEEPEDEEDDLSRAVMEQPDDEPAPLVLRDTSEATDEEWEAHGVSMSAAQEAMCNGELDIAIEQFGACIAISPDARALAQRAAAYLRVQKPRAALADALAAIGVNPDSAKACKVAAKAECVLGQFDAAFAHLCTANKIDGDDSSLELQKKLSDRMARAKKNALIKAAKVEREAEEAAEAEAQE